VQECLSGQGLKPGDLMLEVTENSLMREPGALDLLAQLRTRGVRIAIDDFGTGYSSLAYLRQLPVDILKMDKQFVGDLPDGGALAQTIIGLADALKLALIAEGVETEEQAAALRAMGCSLGQGYLFARPLPEEQLTAHLALTSILEANLEANLARPS
jgi:diguanylate cyclase